MNVYDSARMADLMVPFDYKLTDTSEDADLVVLNTCHIREKAEDKVYSDLGRLRKLRAQKEESGGQMLIAVGGCVGQAEGEEIIKRAPYVDMVFGSQSYHNLPEMVAKTLRDGSKGINLDFSPEPKFDFLLKQSSAEDGVFNKSEFISIQEGCDKFCTFCVVPYTRGAEFSRGSDAILAEARNLVERGTVEITLLGQNVNAYHGVGSDGKDWSLAKLIRELAKIEGLERIRYMTSHPRDMDDELIATHGDIEKLMPLLHLPVQSGSDNILAKMNRKHKADYYLGLVDKLRKARPDITLSSDFIVGFPGESELDFTATKKLVETVGFSQAYTYTYSPRPGTPAAANENQIDESVKNERLTDLQGLIMRQQKAYNTASIGKTVPVLLDRKGKLKGQLLGKSSYGQSVHVLDAEGCEGQILDVVITGALQNSVSGVIQQSLERKHVG